MEAKVTIENNVKQKLLDSLAEESPMVISTAYAYAKNYVMYGEDITKAWTTAVQQASIIEQIKIKAQAEAYDYFKKDYENRLKADKLAMLEELKSYIQLMASLETDPLFAGGEKYCVEIIQQKIDKLKEKEDGENNN